MKPFRYSGADGSCLWCADPLRVDHVEVREDTGEWYPLAECYSCNTIVDRRGEHAEWTALTPEEYGEAGWFRCKRCGNESKGRKRERIVSRTKRFEHDRGGYNGDGRFCTLRCGYQFAMALANGGLRLELHDGKLVWLKEKSTTTT